MSKSHKNIAILRHGKSSWDDPSLRDFDRPLLERGQRASVAIGKEMKRRGVAFDLVLASPAQRAVETLGYVAEGYGAELPVRLEPRIYGADAPELLQIIQEADERADRILIVGHNPALQHLISLLAEPDDPQLAQVEGKFPTAALALLSTKAGTWNAVEAHRNRLKLVVRPKDLKLN